MRKWPHKLRARTVERFSLPSGKQRWRSSLKGASPLASMNLVSSMTSTVASRPAPGSDASFSWTVESSGQPASMPQMATILPSRARRRLSEQK